MRSPRAPVGENTGRFRRQRGLSVSELARQSAVSKATILALEVGDANPTIDTLQSIANALDVTLADLVTEHTPYGVASVQRLGDSEWTENSDYKLRALGTLYGSDLVHVLHVVVGEEGYTSQGHEADSLECVFVLSGTAAVGHTDEPLELGAGDWARYPADVPHRLRAVSGTAEVLMIMRRNELSRNLLPIEKP